MRIRQTLAGLGAALASLTPCCALHAATITLDDALQAAARNLDVSIAARAATAAQADVRAADQAPLPQLSAKLSQIDLQNGIGPGNLLRDKRIDKGVGIDWTWERGDKRGLRTEAARRAAAAAGADLDDVRLQQMLAAHAAFIDLLTAQERLAEVRDIEAGTRQLASTAARRLQAGDLAQQDAARAAIEAQRAAADTEAALQDVQRARLALALQAGLADNELVARAEWPAAPAVGTDIAPPSELVDQRADVRAAAERVRAAEAALAGARALRTSDVTWGASFDHIPGTSTRQVELRAQMPLVWGERFEGEAARASALLEQSRDQLERTRRVAAADWRRLRGEMLSAAARERTYRDEIVPRSREVLQRAEAAYARGALPLTDLLDARRTLRSTLLEALAVRADLAKAIGAWQLRTAAPRPATDASPKSTP
jgi:cobalt-zinc-cadmium efflux system outer membrane protein